MTASSALGRATGALLIVVLVTGLIVPYVMLLPLSLSPTAFLHAATRMAPAVRLAVLQLFVGSGLSVGISIAMFTTVRERAPGLGLWVVALAVVNFALQLVENSHWLTMLSVGQAHAAAGASQAGPFEVVGIAVYSAWRWAHYAHIFVAVGWLFTFFLLLFRTAMVPRVLSASGMALCVLHGTGMTIPAFMGFRMPYSAFFGMPLGFGVLSTSAWLIAMGFPEPGTSTARRGATSQP